MNEGRKEGRKDLLSRQLLQSAVLKSDIEAPSTLLKRENITNWMRGTGFIRVDSANFIQYLLHEGVHIENSGNITTVDKTLDRRCNIKPPNLRMTNFFIRLKLLKLNRILI
jgi:hypothetical protein